MDACGELCIKAARIAATAGSPRRFLVRFGRSVAGVRSGPFWFLDAGSGGRNLVRGMGFRPEFDDGTRGQARHFAGIVAASVRIGPALTRWASIHVLRDPADTPDGRLTEKALEFSELVRTAELPLPEAAAWLSRELCAHNGDFE